MYLTKLLKKHIMVYERSIGITYLSIMVFDKCSIQYFSSGMHVNTRQYFDWTHFLTLHNGNNGINTMCQKLCKSWWRHEMETFSASLVICAGNSPVTGEFPAQKPVTRSFDVFFDLHLNKQLSKKSWGWWFETQSHPLSRHCNVLFMLCSCFVWLDCARFVSILLDNFITTDKIVVLPQYQGSTWRNMDKYIVKSVTKSVLSRFITDEKLFSNEFRNKDYDIHSVSPDYDIAPTDLLIK